MSEAPRPPLLPVWACRLLAAILILGAAGLHIAYLAHNCPLDLSPDEAHYWDWSRHLDLSYYSKGPLVAYLIRAGCVTAGAWSEHTTANLALAVRLPAVVCGSLLLLSLYILTVQVYRRETLALAIVGIALTLPIVTAASTLMTIDAPYTCCWGWALVLGRQAIFRGSSWAWPAAGLVVGLGILAKYTMVLWLPSVGLFLLFQPEYRRLLVRPGFWIMSAITGICCLPILIWNIRNGWVTFYHVERLSGVGFHWSGPQNYLVGQAAILLGYWFVVWFVAMAKRNPLADADSGDRYLWWLSAPMFLLFLGFSFRTNGGEPNWPVTAYLSGLVLAASWLAEQLASPRRWYRRYTALGLSLACILGLTTTAVMHHTGWIQPFLAQISGPPTRTRPMPMRRFDPTCRLRGFQYLAQTVDEERAHLRADNEDPVLAASSWALPGELGVYCAGHPQAYSLGLAMGDRHSQYDFWPNPLDDAAAFRGRTFIVVGWVAGGAKDAFDRVEPPRQVVYTEKGRPIAEWTITVCHGYHGFPKETDAVKKF